MQEIWKDIPGYEGLYQVSNLGNVKSVHWNHSNEIRTIKPFNNNGYWRVVLYKDRMHKKFLVHVLVAKSFIPNPQNKPCVNHIDGNGHNNMISNLEWVTFSENTRHAIAHNLRPAGVICIHKRGCDSPLAKGILQTSLDNKFSRFWSCSQEAANELNFSVSAIRRCCRGERKTYKGFYWCYIKEPSNNK